MALVNFLQSLSNDPQKIKAFETDPHAEMTAAGLTDEEKAALTSGDPAKIRQAVGAGTAAFLTVGVTISLNIS